MRCDGSIGGPFGPACSCPPTVSYTLPDYPPRNDIPVAAIEAGADKLWELYENLEDALHCEYAFPGIPADEWFEQALKAAMPYLQFSPLGDNHHNANACPYCKEN